MKFKTLENSTPLELAQAFNHAFSDYVVPLSLTEAQMIEKIAVDRINLDHSIGAFENDTLIGFILHGEDLMANQKVVYNAGTGVLPAYRGQKLAQCLYQEILPKLVRSDREKCILEVLHGNTPAIKTYSSIGFKVTRDLICFKGRIKSGNSTIKWDTETIALKDSLALDQFWDWGPTWQNASKTVAKLADSVKAIGHRHNDKIVSYAIYNPTTGRVSQFGVDQQHRQFGLGKSLFQYIDNQLEKEISVINIDSDAKTSLNFLQSIGLTQSVSQHEMVLEL